MLNFIQSKMKNFRGRLYKFNILVMSNFESIDYILKNPKCSVARFGDGELDIINGKSIPYQEYNPELAHNLKTILLRGSNSNLMVCLPDVFKKLNRYNSNCKNFYYEEFFYQNRKILRKIESENNTYGSTFISRPYIDLNDKSNANNYFPKLKQLWDKKDILIVEGKYSRSGEGNDLFANAKSVRRILCPAKNAFSCLSEIEQAIKKYSSDKLILLMLGPTAKLIVNDLYTQIPNQLIDLGHIDSEYEWFLMGANSKVKIPFKHTAEFNYDDNKVKLKKDNEFKKQVIIQINCK